MGHPIHHRRAGEQSSNFRRSCCSVRADVARIRRLIGIEAPALGQRHPPLGAVSIAWKSLQRTPALNHRSSRQVIRQA
ncbi:hypothetical protein SJA_C2-04860 [Sphingobium indicum UT26S]|uniref:Uncharacterized protein n=1 Tax=Sphingobium indicum (strain DSM 16413 / CCM 7287 / MTCC 6362 / UT26 / NBRC 101211 / UT26S) TaxID=452662 RepID=D4Z6Z1_SPHIU|nr:hypothetical protein SJA_C2-04860 [Sphingobium indicum UT26S]